MRISLSPRIDNIAWLAIGYLLFARQASLHFSWKGLQLAVLMVFLIGISLLFKIGVNSRFVFRSRWILLSLATLAGFYLVGYGNKAETLKLAINFLMWYGVFIISYFTGLYNRKGQIGDVLSFIFVFTALFLIPFALRGISVGSVTKEFSRDFFGQQDPLIVFWPMIFVLETIGFAFAFYRTRKLKYRYLYVFLFVVVLIAVLLSGFTAVLFMVMIGYLGYLFLLSSRKGFLKRLLLVSTLVGIGVFGLNYIASGKLGPLGGTTDKVAAFMSLSGAYGSHSQQSTLLDKATSGRWSELSLSIESFLSKPIFGYGYDWNEFTPVSSMHSSILDNLAYFGVFSFFIFMIYFDFTIKAYRLAMVTVDSREKQQTALFFGVMLSYLLINLINPYFYYPIINEVIFLLGGWVYGQMDYKRMESKKLSAVVKD